uniref:Uncharacterized protein n=1 Tax=Salmonella phage PMBT35 TaxID=3137287 RepID=A0AAU8BV45_9VIRU
MIYIHRFKVAFGHKQREIKKIYDTYEEAKAQQCVLGGSIQAYEAVENIHANEHYKDLVVDEVACIIDDMSTTAPGSPRMLKAGSPEWDSYKIKTLNNIRNMLAEIY